METIAANQEAGPALDRTGPVSSHDVERDESMGGKPVEIVKTTCLQLLTIMFLAVVLVFSGPETAKGKEAINTADTVYIYQKNAAFNDFLKHRDEYEKVGEFESAAKLSRHKEVQTFDNYMPYRLWAVYLVKHGIRIKNQLENMIVELSHYDDSAKGDPKPIERILSNATRLQEGKIHYEEDVADFIRTFIATGIAEKSDQIGSINLVTDEINRSYDRLFTLATYKLNNISNSKAAETNTTLSREAVGLAKIAIIISIAIGILQIIISVLPLFQKTK